MKFLILLLISGVHMQSADSIRFEKIMELKADKIFADRSDNLYILSGNILQKYNTSNDQILEFSSESGEIITDLDCQNPHKLILYYNDQNKCTFLDNKLNKIDEDIFFENIGIAGEALISTAFDGGFIIYDKTYGILYKTDPKFNIEYQKYIDFEVNPVKMFNNKRSFIFISETGDLIIYSGDLNIKNTIPEKNHQVSVNILEGIYSYLDRENKLIKVKSLEAPYHILMQYLIPENMELTDILIGNKKVFALTDSAVYVGKLP